MMRTICRTLVPPVALGLVSGACAVDVAESPSTDDRELRVGNEVVPADYRDRRDVRCETGDRPKTDSFEGGPLAGHQVEYFSSSELDYGQNDWPDQQPFSWTALSGKLGVSDAAVDLVVVDIRNVDGVPHYHYFSNGSRDHLNQNWSSTKVVAELGAIHRIRMASGGAIGADSIVNDAGLGRRHFADHTYALHDTSSNASGGLFKHLAGLSSPTGGGLNATSFVRGWLSRPNERFNGYYGYSRYDGYYDIRSDSSGRSLVLDTSTVVSTPNHLSPLAMAEFWKRIGVNFRDPSLLPSSRSGASYGYRPGRDAWPANAYVAADASSWQPTVTHEDLLTMFYGDDDPNADTVGGMLHDIGIRTRYTSAFGGSDQLDGWTDGHWRVFGKTGSGRGNSAYGAYVCLPHFRGGREFAVFILGKAPSGTWATRTALGNVVDMFAPGLRDEDPDAAVEPAPIECPDGWALETVGDEGGRYCTDGESMYGPFTRTMIEKCREWGGGAACETNNWNVDFALWLRGDGLCPAGAYFDRETGYCAEGIDAFGPFPAELVTKCEEAGGGPACRTARWNRDFLRWLQR